MDYSRTIFRAFKAKGLFLSSDATTAVNSVISKEESVEDSLTVILSEICERIEKQEIRTSLIDVDTITSVVAYLTSSEEDLELERFQLMDAFSSPKLTYDEKQKAFKIEANPKYEILGNVESRASMYRERLMLTQLRLLRSGLFVMKGMGDINTLKQQRNNAAELSTIESLLGGQGTKVLFGMLTQPEDGSWFLEDLGSIIKLDISQAKLGNFLFTEGCQVVVQGYLSQGCLRVEMMGFPPAEDRITSLKAIGISDIYGNGTRSNQIVHMEEMEKNSTDTMVVILSDVQLDKPLVVEKLSQIFHGFEMNGVDPLFVIMGSFISKPITRVVGGRESIKLAFNTLADTINQFPRIAQNAKFLIVPGPMDAGSSSALPRRPIPTEFISSLKSKVKNITFASNPCRVRFYTQEIVLFREDLLKKMQRHVVNPMKMKQEANKGDMESDMEESDITQQLVESILDQAHLCPLPLHARPVHWELDYTLRLFPLPHLLILADHADHYSYVYKACTTVNPGSFSSDYSFVVYRPASKSVEFSRVV
eukprot:gene13213-17712_t